MPTIQVRELKNSSLSKWNEIEFVILEFFFYLSFIDKSVAIEYSIYKLRNDVSIYKNSRKDFSKYKHITIIVYIEFNITTYDFNEYRLNKNLENVRALYELAGRTVQLNLTVQMYPSESDAEFIKLCNIGPNTANAGLIFGEIPDVIEIVVPVEEPSVLMPLPSLRCKSRVVVNNNGGTFERIFLGLTEVKVYTSGIFKVYVDGSEESIHRGLPDENNFRSPVAKGPEETS